MRRAALLAATLAAAACGAGARPPEPAPAPAVPGTNIERHERAVPPWSPADPPPVPVTVAGPTLFARLGGLDALRGVVDSLIARVAADRRISAFFAGVDIPELKRLLVEQLCQASGGPCRYSGRSMPAAHEGLNLTDAHFDALVEDLVWSLDRFGVPERERRELLGLLGGMRAEIVGR
jgi:hemoglobin